MVDVRTYNTCTNFENMHTSILLFSWVISMTKFKIVMHAYEAEVIILKNKIVKNVEFGHLQNLHPSNMTTLP